MWLNSDEDIKDLYDVCSKVKHILLWCYLPQEKKRKHELGIAGGTRDSWRDTEQVSKVFIQQYKQSKRN